MPVKDAAFREIIAPTARRAQFMRGHTQAQIKLLR
jgi:hypothetical protein